MELEVIVHAVSVENKSVWFCVESVVFFISPKEINKMRLLCCHGVIPMSFDKDTGDIFYCCDMLIRKYNVLFLKEGFSSTTLDDLILQVLLRYDKKTYTKYYYTKKISIIDGKRKLVV